MKAVIIDYSMGNLGSVKRAFEECDADVTISDSPQDLYDASHIILPGVGAFADGMKHLKDRGWIPVIKEVTQNTPLLGICLGMQLLADYGTEGGGAEGLSLIPGQVTRIEATASTMRIPHVGWNEIVLYNQSHLFDEIPDGTDFYFVHSYHFNVENKENIVSTTSYGNGFVSSVNNGHVFGVQFHPEKSQKAGFRLIRNFLSL